MDAHEVRLDWLRAFLAVIETGGFTAAAARLHPSPPPLHTPVKQRAAGGGPLLRFEARKLHLTPRGQEVELLARAVLAALDRFAARQAGRAAVTPVLSAGRALQLHLLAHTLRGWPGPLSLRTEDRAATAEAVRSGRAHLGLTTLLEPDPALESVQELAVGQVAVVPKADPLARRKRIRVRDLAGRPLVLPPADRSHRTTLAGGPRAGLGGPGAGGRWGPVGPQASLGLGLTVVNAYIPAPPGTVAVTITDLPQIRVHLIRRRGAPALPEVDALAQHLARHLATHGRKRA